LTHVACCRDDRVGAAVISAAPWRLATDNGRDALAPDGPPALLLHGTADANVPLAITSELYALLLPPRLMIGIDGAGHSESLESPLEPPIAARAAAQRAVIAVVEAIFRGRDRALDAALTELAAEGHLVQADL
jgi:pimeloyl-ACP methyl ester carboxylesterase